jgi:uncharacterized Zn finger protein (UPF0148 family)
MEPEIARRCKECGASVRGGSFFCPQCGRPLKAAAAGDSGPAAEAPSETPARRATDAGQSAPTIAPPGSETGDAPGVAPAQDMRARPSSVEGRRRAEIITHQAADDGGHSRRRRVTAAAREVVEEKLSPRVEKLRHASNVMLEEASYDPSLRFVLVAAAVIILSLLLFLLNYLLG